MITEEIRDQQNTVLAVRTSSGDWKCPVCPTPLQRAVTGDITDGMRAHYRTVHPERKIR